MATSKDVFSLRKEGHLDSAYKLALEINNCQNPDIWDVRALAWCLIDLIKRDFKNGNYDNLEEYRQRLHEIVVDPSEDDLLARHQSNALSMCDPNTSIFFQAAALCKQGNFSDAVKYYYKVYPNIPQKFHTDFGWALYRYARQIFNQNTSQVHLIKKYISTYLSLNIEKPSKLHSAFLWLAKELTKNNKLDMGKFLCLWGMENFLHDDFLRRTTDDGRHYPALAEDVLQRAIKSAIRSHNIDQINYFMPFLEDFINHYPDNQWFIYYMGKSLVCLGRITEARKYCKSICKCKPNDFWTWDLLGDTYKDDHQAALSCYAKALLCPAEDDMTINLRIKVTQLLVKLGYHEQAKFEISRCKSLKSDSMPVEIANLMSQPWYNNSSMPSSNKDFYYSHALGINELLLDDLPWIDAVIGNVFTYHREDRKPDQIRRKIFIKSHDNNDKDSEFKFPFESFCIEKNFPYSNLKEGTPIRIKGESIPNKPYQILAFSLRDGETWDIFSSHIGVISFVNMQKKMYHAVIGKPLELFFPFNKINISLHIGDFIKLNISKTLKEKYNIINIEKTSVQPDNNIYKHFTDENISNVSNGFGFTDSGIFIPVTIINRYHINKNDKISGTAVLNYNAKRNQWDWKVINIKN